MTAISRWRAARDAAAVPLGIAGILVSLYGLTLAIISEQFAAGVFWLVLGEIVCRDQERYLARRETEERRALLRQRAMLRPSVKP